MSDYTWPSREEWETDQRAYAEELIEFGFHRREELSEPSYTRDEKLEIQEDLAPGIIAVFRRAFGRIERELRGRYPAVVPLVRPKHLTYDEALAAENALTADERTALATLLWVRDMRTELSLRSCAFDAPLSPLGWTINADVQPRRLFVADWPKPFEPPSSPELDRLHALSDQAFERHRNQIRDFGRKILADLDSGTAWAGQLKHMASCDEWRRTGPVVHRIGGSA